MVPETDFSLSSKNVIKNPLKTKKKTTPNGPASKTNLLLRQTFSHRNWSFNNSTWVTTTAKAAKKRKPFNPVK